MVTERVTGHTEVIGLLAYPIRHSMSPTMHNEAFKKSDLDYIYEVFEVDNENLAGAVAGIKALGIKGCNVSMPNKIAILEYLDEVSPIGKLIGACNTVVNEDGKLWGTNTDGTGCELALKKHGIDIKGKNITLVGMGGAGVAIFCQLALSGAKSINAFNIKDKLWKNTEEKVQEVREKTNAEVALFDLDDKEKLKQSMHNSDIFIQSTSIGMKPHEGQSVVPDSSYFHDNLVVHDTIYSPRHTKTMELAEEAGCSLVLNGMDMMLYQGAEAFKCFTGEEMPVDYIRDVLFD